LSDHFRPTAEIAPDVLLPGDPGLALALAQALMVKPLMANHHHGLWGYSGVTAHGNELTVQASGIGGPSAAVVVGELAEHGAARIIRIGRAVALDAGLAPGEGLIVGGALADDGASRALGEARPRPAAGLTAALVAADPNAREPITVASCDLVGELAAPAMRESWVSRGAVAADLETAAVLAAAASQGLAAAALLVTGEGTGGERDEQAVERGLLELGALALEGFAAEPAQAPEPGARLP
jgi:uridine phosphorylase